MAFDDFRRILIEIDTVNDYIAPIILSGGDINGRTIVVKLTDNGNPVLNVGSITAKLAYRVAGQSSGWFKTMEKVDGYGTAAWSCAAPGSVLRSEYATFASSFAREPMFSARVHSGRRSTSRSSTSALRLTKAMPLKHFKRFLRL